MDDITDQFNPVGAEVSHDISNVGVLLLNEVEHIDWLVVGVLDAEQVQILHLQVKIRDLQHAFGMEKVIA